MTATDDAGDLRGWLAARWPDYDWRRGSIVHGAFHQVVLCGTSAVARIAPVSRYSDAEADTARAVARLGLSVAVPRLLAPPVRDARRHAVLLSFVPGEIRTGDTSWELVRPGLEALLEEFRALPRDDGFRWPSPRAWCGGDRWPDVVDELLQHLPGTARTAARRVVADVVSVERGVDAGFVHGDLGLHNMLWSAGRLRGLIDFDHACWGDPAIDLAPFVGSFGAAQVVAVTSPDVLHRAMVHRASLPLQVAAAAELRGVRTLRDQALRNFITRLGDGTLHDPGSTSV